jgi:hypothetical protein
MTVSPDPRKVRARIRRYESKLKSRHYRDGGGTRFLIGPLYLLLDDTDGALAHYRWFDRKFPDSMDEPFHALSRMLAMLRAKEPEDELHYRLRRAHIANPYFIPALLGIAHGQPDVRRGCNWRDEEYLLDGPQEFLRVWRPEEKAWLRSVWESPAFVEFVRTHISIVSQLAEAPVGPERSELIEQLFALPTGAQAGTSRSRRTAADKIVH